MSEEEKEAIECLKGLCTDDCVNHDIVDTVINLIEKQQKEIEALEIIHETYKEVVDNGEFISKDKIKEKIKELQKNTPELQTSTTFVNNIEKIQLLQELLGEEQ